MSNIARPISAALETAGQAARRLEQAGFPESGWQRIIDDPSYRQRVATAGAREEPDSALTAASPLYADEEVSSEYGYPAEYERTALCKQFVRLSRAFPDLQIGEDLICGDEAIPLPPLPQGAEGWFAIPRWQKIASSYNAALVRVLEAIGDDRTLENWCEGQLGEEYLRLADRTAAFLALLGEQQDGDVLLVPAQIGKRHAGRSVRRSREVIVGTEFGLGPYEVSVMTLTNPQRFTGESKVLYVDCPGGEYTPDDGRFSRAPCFGWDGSVLYFIAYGVGNVNANYGSASGFLPQPAPVTSEASSTG